MPRFHPCMVTAQFSFNLHMHHWARAPEGCPYVRIIKDKPSSASSWPPISAPTQLVPMRRSSGFLAPCARTARMCTSSARSRSAACASACPDGRRSACCGASADARAQELGGARSTRGGDTQCRQARFCSAAARAERTRPSEQRAARVRDRQSCTCVLRKACLSARTPRDKSARPARPHARLPRSVLKICDHPSRISQVRRVWTTRL